jgi:DNA-binding response OmpR family regulator
MDKGTVLVVEDEANIADLVDLYLSRDGYRVLKQATGEGGLAALRDHRPRLVVLDVGLPDIDGLEVCRRIRATSTVPVIFLTARADEVDRVLGLELGADDYVTKPFSPRELIARVKAVLRRVHWERGPSPGMSVGRIHLDQAAREVAVSGQPLDLTAKEFDLLACLMENPGVVLSREELLERVWGSELPEGTRTVDVHVAQLRRKLDDAEAIRSVRGRGYKLQAPYLGMRR